MSSACGRPAAQLLPAAISAWMTCCGDSLPVAAKALLEKNPDPSDEELRYWLAGNLCRCTGYDKIIHAVMDVAKEMRK